MCERECYELQSWELGGRTKACGQELRGGEAWRADGGCVSFHIPLQLQRRGGDI